MSDYPTNHTANDQQDSENSVFSTENFIFALAILFFVFVISLIGFMVFVVKEIPSPMKEFNFIGQIHGGEKRCFTFMIPENTTSIYISAHHGTYSIDYDTPLNFGRDSTHVMRQGIVDFTPVDHCN